jgi:hypothetical protein
MMGDIVFKNQGKWNGFKAVGRVARFALLSLSVWSYDKYR